VGGERVKLIHVIDSVMYNLASILDCSGVQRRVKQPHYSLNYTAFICYKFLLTYSL